MERGLPEVAAQELAEVVVVVVPERVAAGDAITAGHTVPAAFVCAWAAIPE
jgi:hypothetical protein